MRTANTFIGQSILRVEDERFLRGEGQFVDDIRVPEDAAGLVLHAAILRSPLAHGRITAIDIAAARAMPGVRGVITASEIGAALGAEIPRIPIRQDGSPEMKRFEQPVIAREKVRYVGEPVALVVADTPGEAEDALAAIALDIAPLAVVTDQTNSRADMALLFEEIGTNTPTTVTAVKGDVDAAFASAPFVRSARFKVQRHTAVPMEARGVMAHWDTRVQRLFVYGAVKVPFPNRKMLADMLGLDVLAVSMVEKDAGGGFGVRGEFYPEDFLIPFAAKLLERPVKWIEDRREHLLTTNHARDVECTLELACAQDGVILGLRGRADADIGAYVRTAGATPARNVAQVINGPYRIPNSRIEVVLQVSNKTPVGTYRGPGRFEADFFRERLFDLAADELGIDRIAFRRKNLIAEAEQPYTLATVVGLNIPSATDSGDYAMTFDRCLTEFGWNEKAELQGRLIDGRYHGIATGCYFEGGASGPREHARIALDADGAFSVYIGSSAIGQALETSFTQIAADALEMPMERIRVFHGSTDYLKEGFGSYSSRSVVMGGSAVVDAANKVRGLMRSAAARRLNCAADAVVLEDGAAMGPDGRSVRFTELAGEGIEADGVFASSTRTYSYGAHAAHVTVCADTGQVDVLDYVAVEDVGRIINPKTLHGQTEGALVQGLGGALLEHLVYDDQGQLLTATLADYLMPASCNFPHFHTVALEAKPSPNNPLGAKGAGEGGIIPVGGVIANAVANALSSMKVQPCELPLSPPRVWRMMEDAKAVASRATSSVGED